MLKWINLFLINLLYFFNKFIGHYIANFFARKKLKKLSSEYKKFSINIKSKNGIYLDNIYLDKLRIDYIDKITCDSYKLLYTKSFLHILDKVFIIFNDNYEKKSYLEPESDIKFINLENMINNGLDNMQKILDYLLLSHKFIIKHLSLLYCIYKFSFNNFVIVKKNDFYSFKINYIDFFIDSIKTIKLKNISASYQSTIDIVIEHIDLKIVKFEDIIDVIDKLKKLNSGESTDIKYKIVLKNIHISFKNINIISVIVRNLCINNEKISLDKIDIINFKKKIVKLDNIRYNLKRNSFKCKEFKIDLYKSTFHKIYLSLNKYIKKKKMTKDNINEHNNISDILIDSYINYSKTVNEKNDSIETNYLYDIPNNLSESFIVTKKTDNLLIDSYINKSYIKKLIFNLDTFIINIYDNNCIRSQSIIRNLEYNNIINNEINIYINNWEIKNNVDYLIRKKNNINNILNINYYNGELDLSFSNLVLNLIIDEFIFIYNTLNQNILYLNKLLYNNYNQDYIGKAFFIKHIKIHPLMCSVSYYPKKCSYYKFLGNITEIYKNIDYENMLLNLVYINLYYPSDFQDLLKNVLKTWLTDIKENQIKNIIKSTKFNALINNTPVNITKYLIGLINNLMISLTNLF
uniref:Uncharacterized protein n=1 Tax=viral metagenome TaxID=1070528 RepID=A0A6C0IYC9_9ZZZZ